MKNEQKYKTPEERVEAFDSWRRTIKCEGCSQMCDTCEAGPLADECGFKWLALEAVGEEKVADCNHLGNAAKIREALEDAEKVLDDSSHSMCGIPPHMNDLLARIRAALSAPPRNCDVGTVAEQDERFDKYCYDHRSHEICCGKCPIFGEPCCELAWSQMPYEEGAEK